MSAAIAAREEVGMRSVKPGRGPSMMGGIGAVIAIVFGVVWTLSAAQMGAPGFFPLFGVLFILVGVVQAVYNFKNAGSKNRFFCLRYHGGGGGTRPAERALWRGRRKNGIRERRRGLLPLLRRGGGKGFCLLRQMRQEVATVRVAPKRERPTALARFILG